VDGGPNAKRDFRKAREAWLLTWAERERGGGGGRRPWLVMCRGGSSAMGMRTSDELDA